MSHGSGRVILTRHDPTRPNLIREGLTRLVNNLDFFVQLFIRVVETLPEKNVGPNTPPPPRYRDMPPPTVAWHGSND